VGRGEQVKLKLPSSGTSGMASIRVFENCYVFDSGTYGTLGFYFIPYTAASLFTIHSPGFIEAYFGGFFSVQQLLIGLIALSWSGCAKNWIY